MTTTSGMQAALYVREKQKQRNKKIRRGRVELPSNVATKEIAPFPRYPPNQWGKAAWQERDRQRRASAAEVAVNHRIKATEAHRRWMKKNRIHDSSFSGSSSDDEDYAGGLYGHQNSAANALLYVGLGTIAIGLVISFVGTGEKGFKTLELRLIGPTLIGSGLMCCLIRIFLCVCPSKCFQRRHKHRHRHKNSVKSSHLGDLLQQPSAGHFNHNSFFGTANSDSKDHNRTEDIAMADQTKLLRNNINKKTVSIVTTPVETATTSNLPSGSSGHNHRQQNDISLSSSLFLKHERQCSTFSNRAHPLQIPTINIPNFVGSNDDEEDILGSRQESKRKHSSSLDLELQKLDSGSFDISTFESSNEIGGILRVAGSVEGSGRYRDGDKRRTSLTSVHRNGGATLAISKAVAATTVTSPPSTRIGLVNPDPDAHKLEEELEMSSAISKDLHDPLSSYSSLGKHSDIDSLLQNEIVLSPSKLQQTGRDT
ncbi:uncharacterized protein LOC110830287 isoform X2 [Zootermopsis nevadensis]|uniref:uncharacterized protein LOC110830287 isoform X2 n=1 Tax=Zootermopsis nevadensis TaxID=136037 RepID=UPI000B8ED8A2|nr:uncharacterized protein LOC110830287 isoform X2 [Zootermopsis nevadensis]XP_021920693.1 uncharacterized protein LOC110830287 isoform X2 [Zootermopsis nevadensis]XP_021920694.1 uncharacterized protein LOC110830287 isoform X2 [Zootermopsis nevadensis]XP_021920695.1 uncharacterized protein LOC110830287 isoform X2 [Zootermopsis nevadensis]